MNSLKTVIGFTLRTKLLTKSFIITTAILVVLISIGVNLPYIISLFSKDEPVKKIGVLSGSYTTISESLSQAFNGQENKDLQIIVDPNATEGQLKTQLENGEINGYIKLEAAEGASPEAFPSTVYYANKDLGFAEQSAFTSVLSVLKTKWIAKDALSDEQLAQLEQPVRFDTVNLKDSEEGPVSEADDMRKMVSTFVVLALIILFFMTNMMTGNMIAAEVTQEKSSRIMEILITSVSPLAQMFGKIIGMFILGLIQIIVFLLAAFVNLMLPHNAAAFKDINFDISMIDPNVVLLGIVFFILGYFLYATLFAAVGSIVSRTEDLGQAIMPITMLSLAAFYIASFSVSAPDSMLVKISSFFPFFSPTTMLLRIGAGNYAAWEVIVSVLILIVSILACGWLSAKIYRTGVLMYGKRPSWKEIRKAMKAYKI